MKEKILVTRSSLPPLEEYIDEIKDLWETRWLTNMGVKHQLLEEKLREYLDTENITLFDNGHLALESIIQVMDLKGEVITTPFTFISTTHAIVRSGLTPVFCDINYDDYTIDVSKIEDLITERTSAIIPVHVYGNICDYQEIDRIAKKYNLKVIYDAAHAFGVRQEGRSLLLDGDLSVLSFHATKVFNTFEGGAIVCHSAEMKEHIDHLKNFGITDEVTVCELGINGKMSEINAAFGLLELKYVDDAIERRGEIDKRYRELFSKTPGIECLAWPPSLTPNFSYFPILVSAAYPLTRDELYEKLRQQGIYTRRYFYPLISQFPMYSGIASAAPQNLPVATDIASRVLCLPIYPNLSDDDVQAIAGLISSI